MREPGVGETRNLRENTKGFSGGLDSKESAGSAGDLGSIPGLGRPHVPWGNQAHAPQLLSPRTLQPVLHNKRSHVSQKPAHRS